MTFYIRRFILMQFSERFNEDILSFYSRAKTDLSCPTLSGYYKIDIIIK